jgi:hypothetical protein
MGYDVGLWDRLFGEKIAIEVPGPEGIRNVQVTAKWLARMESEGKIARVSGEFVTAHILDPMQEYHTATWTIGQDISKDELNGFLDESTHAVYVLRIYRDGKRESILLRKDVWDETKRKFEEA